MSRRPANGAADESDDDEGFKVTNSGRKKGTFPNFLPELARRQSLVDALYHSHIDVKRRRGSVSPQRNAYGLAKGAANSRQQPAAEDDASAARKRVIHELAKTMEAKLPTTKLPPLPKALEQRRRNEERMAQQMELRVNNSSPGLSHRLYNARLECAQEMAAEKRKMQRSKGWAKQTLADRPPRPQCESAPPSLGLTHETRIEVEYKYVLKPWEDPKIAALAATVTSEAIKAERAKKQAMDRDAEAVRASERSKCVIPFNDEFLAAPLFQVYDYGKYRS